MDAMTREYSNAFLQRVEEGYYNTEELITAFVKYLSEDEVKDFLLINELWDFDEEDEH